MTPGLRRGQSWLRVGAGLSILLAVSAGGAEAGPKIQQPLTAPQLLSPPDLAIFSSQESSLNGVHFAWTGVEGATSYRLTVEFPPPYTGVGHIFDVGDTALTLHFAMGGEFHWSVAAERGPQDPPEIGPVSATRSFTIFGGGPAETFTPTPSPTPAVDLNHDGKIDWQDVYAFSTEWESHGSSLLCDFLHDQVVDERDLMLLLSEEQRRSNTPTPTPTPIIAPPVLESPTDGYSIKVEDFPTRGIRFTWQPVPGASLYQIRFDQIQGTGSDSFGSRAYPAIDDVTAYTLKSSAFGDFTWQVKSITTDHRAGEYSAPRHFHVIYNPITPTPTPFNTPTTPDSDLNQDGVVNGMDVFTFYRTWQQNQGLPTFVSRADFHTDGYIDERDVLVFIKNWDQRTNGVLPAPQLVSPASGTRFPLVFGVNVTIPLKWNAVAGATRYQVDLIAMHYSIYNTRVWVTGTNWDYHPSPQDTYYWRVRCQGESGRLGPWSEQRGFVLEAPTPTPTATIAMTGTPTPHDTPVPPDPDINQDQQVDGKDLFQFYRTWHLNQGQADFLFRGDFHTDGFIDERDVVQFLRDWDHRSEFAPVPELVAPTDGAHVSIANASVALSWLPIATAHRYLVGIESEHYSVYNQTYSVTSNAYTYHFIVSDTYYWKVRCQDTHDHLSDWSTRRSFFVEPPMPAR